MMMMKTLIIQQTSKYPRPDKRIKVHEKSESKFS
jgi:hypothetical protein